MSPNFSAAGRNRPGGMISPVASDHPYEKLLAWLPGARERDDRLREEDHSALVERVPGPADPGQRVQLALHARAFRLLLGGVAEHDHGAADRRAAQKRRGRVGHGKMLPSLRVKTSSATRRSGPRPAALASSHSSSGQGEPSLALDG